MNRNLIIVATIMIVLLVVAVGIYFALQSPTETIPVSTPDTSLPTTSPAATIPTTSPVVTETPSPAVSTSTLAPAPTRAPEGFTRSTAQTPWNDEGKGLSIYLDRHDVACPAKSGMSGFKLVRKGDGNYREEYSCLTGTDFGDSVALNTPANEWGGGNAVYLDRHTVGCPTGTVMNQWKLRRPKTNEIQFDFKCSNVPGLNKCENLSTPWNDDGKGNAVYLDRHQIECPQNKMLTTWKINRKADDLTKWRYDYTCCGR